MKAKVVGIAVLLLALCGFMAVMTAEPWYALTDSTFLQPNNIENLLRRTAMYGILGIGVTFVIISSGIDLSIGSVVCLSGCLLAIFLNVEYAAFDQRPVLELRASAKQIVVSGPAGDFTAGQMVRYSGGRRARNALVTIVSAEGSDQHLVLNVDQPFSNDDITGQVARVWEIVGFTRADPQAVPPRAAQVTLQGEHPGLENRDQLLLVHPRSGQKQLVITSVDVQGQETQLTLNDDLGSTFDDQWLAVPLERRQRMSVPSALASVFGIAVGLGLVHGLLVTRMRLPPFVVTLCGLLIYRGISRWIVNDQPVGFGNEYETLRNVLGTGKLVLWTWTEGGHQQTFGIPYAFFTLLAVASVAAVFLNKTIWGRYLQALGRNEEAARYSGIQTGRITLSAYVICTALAALGGVMFALDSNSVSPSSFGNFFELYAIAAAVLGGCSLRGGEGSILGVIIGTALMQVLYNLVVLMRISGTLEFAIIGLVILLGVLADEVVRRLHARRKAQANTTG